MLLFIFSETEVFYLFKKRNSCTDLKLKTKQSQFTSYWLYFFFLLAHSQRLVSIQSMLRQTEKYSTLERDLLELEERKLFEYFIVVALHKAKAGVPYLPEVTQQFPLQVKLEAKMLQNKINIIVCSYHNLSSLPVKDKLQVYAWDWGPAEGHSTVLLPWC